MDQHTTSSRRSSGSGLVALMLLAALCASHATVFAAAPDTRLRLTSVIQGLARPTALVQPTDGSRRFFVTEQGSASSPGQIRVVQDQLLLATPFLTLDAATPGGFGAAGNEQGLLGLAFHPNFASNRQVFIDYTDANGDTVIARYQASLADPNRADLATRKVILRIDKDFRNHNGGNVVFGPDGYLYLGTGDGGSANDPCNRAETLDPANLVYGSQSNGTVLVDCNADANFTGAGANPRSLALEGKLLRLDVNQTTPAGTPGYCGWDSNTEIPYRAPPDNLFAVAGLGSTCKEVSSYGLRNPWRFSFDRSGGNLWIGDVGQNQHEEIDVVAAGQHHKHFGWDTCEGVADHELNPGESCPTGLVVPAGVSVVAPVTELLHVLESPYEPVVGQAPATRCSIAGGHVYRGPISALNGYYLYGDYCSGEIFCAQTAGAGISGIPEQCPGENGGLLELFNNGTATTGLTSFAEDLAGNVYVLDRVGIVYRIDGPAAAPAAVPAQGNWAIWLTALILLGLGMQAQRLQGRGTS